jgi:integrase
MFRKSSDIPSYRRHRASGQAVVTLNGVDHYLGPWNSPESRTEYDRVTSQWLTRGRRLADRVEKPDELLVKELVLGYYNHAVATMRSGEAEKIKAALRPVRELYGDTKASAFSSLAFKAVRLKLIEAGLCITTIRQRMGLVRRMVAWGVENEMLPADALQRIEAVSGLRAGRDGVKPSRKVAPAPQEHIEAILPHLNLTVRAMVALQALTGMRPGEVCAMTTGQIDRNANPWIYQPARHKTLDLGKDRMIPLGPRAQELLMPWLKADPEAPLFSPREAVAREFANRGRNGERARKPKASPKRQPRDQYDKNSYKAAVARACVRAGIPVFRPNRIRHSFGTRVRRDYGLEAAQVLLGHSKADVTQLYAECNQALARDVALKIG